LIDIFIGNLLSQLSTDKSVSKVVGTLAGKFPTQFDDFFFVLWGVG